ncbi:hypothetical protein ACWC6I_42365 [Streptomyces sp. NPDC001414]
MLSTVDGARQIDRATRPQLAWLLTRAWRRESHGILVASRIDISNDDREYEAMLDQIRVADAVPALTRKVTIL